MLSRGEAQSVVEATLMGRAPVRRMTSAELLEFTQEMLIKLDYRSAGDHAAEIRRWALAWEKSWFPQTGRS
jgi:hypothetical protein